MKQVQRVLTVAAVAALLGLGATPAEAEVNVNALGGVVTVSGDGATAIGILGYRITLPLSLD
ncbi:hypothetical protein AB0L75_27880 [Streptomyces sp. NPDC052101]|uniref:hypothetical protein n=1 Tax=Streptomyces sp. NPDC052101 TaxID=3155763 RepID=UPI00341FCCB8